MTYPIPSSLPVSSSGNSSHSLASLVALESFAEMNYHCTKRQHHSAGDAMAQAMQKVAAPSSPGSVTTDSRGNAGQADRIEVTVNGVRIEVSPELEDAVKRAQKGLLQPLPREMTTTQAAEFLDVSRPFVIKLTQRGELPFRRVGQHRRIPSEAVLAYREKMFHQAQKAADEMAQLSQDAGIDEQEHRRKAQ
jgi:excisionase family DNA binding protein